MVIRMNARMQTPQPDNAAPIGSGHPEAEQALALIERLNAAGRHSTSELLRELRRVFPDSPLAVRVRALEVLRRL
jgi:hypothetical protein